MIGLIFASTPSHIIGINNTIPWYYHLDFKRFKDITLGSTVIMGRKTFESMGCKLLKGRDNILISSTPDERLLTFSTIPQALEFSTGSTWFIGGKKIYEEALNLGVVDVIDATIVPELEGSLEGMNVTRFNPEPWLKDFERVGVEEHQQHPDERLTSMVFHKPFVSS